MRTMMSFICPDFDVTYEAVYRELSLHLEMPAEETIKRFSPDDAVASLKYHRRQARRREVFQDLAIELNVDVTTVFAACSIEGAEILLSAIQAKRAVFA